MTPKEAREILGTAKAKNRTDYPLDYAVAMEMAITALGAIEQIMWERDMAISQLEEIGVSFGEKMDEVKEALEKQIPKKLLNVQDCYIPETYDYDYSVANCPNCRGVFSFDEYHRPLYCNKCGQKLSFEGLE